MDTILDGVLSLDGFLGLLYYFSSFILGTITLGVGVDYRIGSGVLSMDGFLGSLCYFSSFILGAITLGVGVDYRIGSAELL